jgi:hypothetical protein
MKNTYKLWIIVLMLATASLSVKGAITYSLDNRCATGQLVIMVTPDINYSGATAVWTPAVFTISYPMTLGTGVLGTIANQNGFAWSTAGALGNDGTYYYQKFSHTAATTLAMTSGTSYEVVRIALVGSVGQFANFSIPASTNTWVSGNNGFSVFSNSNGNQVVSPYGASSVSNVPLFAGVIWNGSNWCGGSGTASQPGTGDGSLNCYVIGTGAQVTTWNANVNQLQINTTSQLTIPPGGSLTAAGTVTINSAEGLVISADATGTGSFINTTSPITYGTGASAKVQAYMKHTQTPGTFHIHLIGALVKDPALTSYSSVYLSAFNLLASSTYAYRYNEPTDAWINIYNLTDVVPTAAGLALSDVSGVSKVLSMTGQLATPTVINPTVSPYNPTKTAGQGNGEFLFSNPFPCGLYLDQFYTNNNGSTRFGGNSDFYCWEEENNNYGVWTADDPLIGGGTGTGFIGTANGIINPGQGFFGQRNGTANINFLTGHRVHVHTPFLKTSPLNILRLQASGNASIDELIIRFKDNALASYDEKDADKWASMNAEATEISTVSEDGFYLTINSLPPLTSGQMVNVPMTFKCGIADTYTITASSIESFEPGTEIWLEDLQTGGEWYSLNNYPVYEFTAAPGDPEARFIVHFFGPTGIDDPIAAKNAIQIYGYQQNAYIVNHGTETVKEYRIYDMMGRELHGGTLVDKDVNVVPVNNVSAYYIVKVFTREGGVYTGKVFITK